MLKTSEYCLQGAKEIQELKERHTNGEDIMKGITKEEVREAKNARSELFGKLCSICSVEEITYKVMEIMICNVHYGDTRNALTPERSLKMAAERSYWGTKHHNHITMTMTIFPPSLDKLPLTYFCRFLVLELEALEA
jgi:hypothetical protein